MGGDTLDNIKQYIQGIADENPGSLSDMSARAKEISTTLQQLDTTSMIQQQTATEADSTITDADTQYEHVDYYNKISSYAMLRDPKTTRNISHNFAMEYLMMLCASGQESKVTQYIQTFCLMNQEFTWQSPKNTEIKQFSQEEIDTMFMDGVIADIDAQHDVNSTLLDIEYQARKQYLDGQFALIESMVLQQDALIQSLGDWSNYLDQQAQEYSELYERLNILMNTNKRKDVFEVNDLNSIDKWNKIIVNSFWVFLTILIVMIVVQNYTYMTSSLHNAQEKIQNLAEQSISNNTPADTK